MKAAIVALGMLVLQGNFEHANEVDAAPERFQYQRALQVPAGAQGQACAVIDAQIYSRAGRLNALRIYSGGHEVPFAVTESGEAGQQEEPARVMNLGKQGGKIVFDLAMPRRAYTEVVLDLDGRDFYATAKVSGEQMLGGARTELGQFVLFDLRSRGLSRSTTLALQETSFPVLHVEMSVTPAPGGDVNALESAMVRGAAVPPSREAQMLFTTVAVTSDIATKGRQSVASIRVPAHVPVERASFVLQPSFAKNFSRGVRITAKTQDGVVAESVAGEIQRVKLPIDFLGQEIRNEQLTVEALLAANLHSDAVVEVAVENGDDQPLPLQSVQLQMRQRKICFDAELGAAYVVRYGDAAPVRAPVYDYARLFRASAAAANVTMGDEVKNPEFRGEVPRESSYKDRHPELLWVALLLVIGVLGTVAIHNARRVGRGKAE